MTVKRTTAYATTSGIALPGQPGAPAVEARTRPAPVVRDLRERSGRGRSAASGWTCRCRAGR